MTFISDVAAMTAILNVLGALCASDWISSPSPNFSDYLQHECKPAAKWDAHTVTILFNNGAQTPALPMTNFFVLTQVDGKTMLRLQIQSLKADIAPTFAHGHPNVFGKQFFANQWVEFDKKGLRVGFASATSTKDEWGPFSECSCFQPGEISLGIKTRTCTDRDADGKWCVGASQVQCKSQPCTTTTSKAEGVWSPWSACSTYCGQGEQTRTCTTTSLRCQGTTKRSCFLRQCCSKTCHVCGATRNCDEIRAINTALGKPANNKLCMELEEGDCDCFGCKTCTRAVESCQRAALVLGDTPGGCDCPEHTSGTPTWNGNS